MLEFQNARPKQAKRLYIAGTAFAAFEAITLALDLLSDVQIPGVFWIEMGVMFYVSVEAILYLRDYTGFDENAE